MKEEKTEREKQVKKIKGGERMIKLLNKQRGITLIALVITIIVLIILAAVSISMLTGENGILTKANEAKEAMERANILEEIQIKVFSKQAETAKTQITETDMEDILEQYGTLIYEADGTTLKGITTSKGNYEILLTEVYQGTLVAGGTTPTAPVTDGSYSETKGVNTPQITTGLTAVTINTDGSLVNAELTSDNWYSYTEGDRRWANAKTNDGSMWVWIPRYEYKITYTNESYKSQGGTVDVNFIPTTQTTATSGYTIHPAFTNNVAAGGWDSELAGIWIAKFEAGYAGGNNSVAQVNTGETYSGTVTASNFYGTITSGITQMKYPVFMPKTYSYNNINIGDTYKLSKNLTKSGNPYGFDNTKTDSHMMKNSEWGAVAYLTHSKYGRIGTEITINNVSLNNTPSTIYAVTGFAGAIVSENRTTVAALNAGTSGSYSWETTEGQLASTTENVYGIYDISGGTFEYVAGYINNGNSSLTTYGGTLVSEGGAATNTKHKTIYEYNISSDTNTNNYSMAANTGRKGESIWEISTSGSGSTSWNSDYSNFPSASGTFFHRGGYSGSTTNSGTFCFSRSSRQCQQLLFFSSHFVRSVKI